MLRSSARKPQAQAARRAPLRQSAGLLCYRTHRANRALGAPEIFLVHPGGPFWRNKDAHAWSIPKGELEENEAPLDGARRELIEETGVDLAGVPLRYVASELFSAGEDDLQVTVTFVADAPLGAEPSARSDELAEVGWWTLAEVETDPRCPTWLPGLIRRAAAP